MIGHKRVPSRVGGVEIVVAELSERMAKLGHTVRLYNRYYGGEKLSEWNGCYVLEVPTPPWEKKSSALWYALRATLNANRRKYDVIHFHAEGPCAMIPLARLLNKTCVATIHGLDWQRSKWGGLATLFLKFGERMAARRADEVIVLSRDMQEYFRRKYGRETLLIPNGITRRAPVKADLIKKDFGLSENGYILYLARITPEKGLHYLIEAYAGIQTDIPLVIAGGLEPESMYISKIKHMAEKDKRVKLVGFVTGQTLEELFSNCRVYVLPSDIEGLPISLLEAINFRAPCLVSDIPENRDVAPDYLHVFHQGSVSDLKIKLEEILDQPCVKPDDEETDRILEKYDWDQVTRQTLAAYISARENHDLIL